MCEEGAAHAAHAARGTLLIALLPSHAFLGAPLLPGFLTQDDLASVVSSLGLKVPPTVLADVFREADANCDGKVPAALCFACKQ